MESKIILGNSLEELPKLEADSVDLVCTDPPYGYSFMGKNWDKAVPSVEIWKECLRVLKPGGFAFVMSAPRQDVLSQMIVRIGEAGFDTDFTSIYWTYASGFPKAANIGKMVDKRNGRHFDPALKKYLNERRAAANLSLNQVNEYLGVATNGGGVASALMGDKPFNEIPTRDVYKKLRKLLKLDERFDELIEREEAEREVLASKQKLNTYSDQGYASGVGEYERTTVDTTVPSTDEAKALDGSYGGFQPKPAVEIIIVAMKPLSEKTFVDQALKNGKGIAWLDDCRVPSEPRQNPQYGGGGDLMAISKGGEQKWDGTVDIVTGRFPANLLVSDDVLKDHSRYFSLDSWADTLPFLAVPKASKREKSEGLIGGDGSWRCTCGQIQKGHDSSKCPQKSGNHHPTVKPLTLMSYLITLGSREGDTVLEPFMGSGTTCLAAKHLNRRYIGIEREAEYVEIAKARLAETQNPLF